MTVPAQQTSLPDVSPFADSTDLAALATAQGVTLTEDFERLLGDFWPEDESADGFHCRRTTVAAGRRSERTIMASVVVDTDVVSFLFKRDKQALLIVARELRLGCLRQKS